MRASISHDGILAITNFTDLNLELIDVFNHDNRVDIKTEDATLLGFYDNKALVLTSKFPLRTISVNDLFTYGSLEKCERVENSVSVEAYSDVTFLNVRRIIYCISSDRKLFTYNVDTKKINYEFPKKDISYCASLLGINSCFSTVFKENMGFEILASNSGKEQQIHTMNIPMLNILLSASNPSDIESALILYMNGRYTHKGTISSLKELGVSYNGVYAIVRIYEDIFLIYNHDEDSVDSQYWVIMRIVVK